MAAAANAQADGSLHGVVIDAESDTPLPGASMALHSAADSALVMYIINPEGTLIYKGGIDDKPTTDEADIETATNCVSAALDAAMSGEEVEVETAPPYGCSVKYAAN